MNQNIKYVIAFLLFVALSDVSGQTYQGDLTYYTEWKYGFGSCGLVRSMQDQFQVAALSRTWMALPSGMTNPNNHPLCAAQHCVQIYGAKGSIVVKVSDTCAGCAPNDVDVADSVFHFLDDPVKGRVKITWKFVDCRTNPPGVK